MLPARACNEELQSTFCMHIDLLFTVVDTGLQLKLLDERMRCCTCVCSNTCVKG
jgi:hypothetical protein